jgi:APA family basic amino acid/polyamine antiporter
MVGSVVVLRRKMPQMDRPYRTPAYPWVPLVYILLATLFIADLAWLAPETSGIGYCLVLVGIPIYLVWSRRFRRTVSFSEVAAKEG